MRKLRYLLIMLWVLLFSVTYAKAQVSIGIGLPNVSIGINLPVYPELVRVPNYPVYYAPGVEGNYFFYDGMYWVYQNDTWYASSWYNGPWGAVDPYYVPLYILRVPVRYYRQPPVYFRGWVANRPPRWGQYWGHGWEQRRSGWNRWNRNAAPAPAPLPVYQRQYTGDRYPQAEQQHRLRGQHYRYQPRDKVVRQHLQQVAPAVAPKPPAAAPPVRRTEPPKMAPGQPERPPVAVPPPARPAAPHQQQQPAPRVAPVPQARPAVPHQQQQRSIEQPKKPAPVHAPPPAAVREQKQQPAPVQQRLQEQKPQGRGPAHQPDQRRGQDKDDERGGRGNR